MKFRSLIAAAVAAMVCMGFTAGCGSNGSDSQFVASSAENQQVGTGTLQFNFTRPQAAFSVDVNTTKLKFEFLDGSSASPVFTTTRDFAASITINGVPTSATTVVITSIDANGFPLQTTTQAIEVVDGSTTVVNSVSNPVAVLLKELRVVSADPSKIDTSLTSISVPMGGTFQTFLAAEYSNGTVVLVGNNATYSIASGGESVASVNSLGTISGLAIGATSLNVVFAGQTLQVPLSVTDGLAVNFTSLAVGNTQPISIQAGGSATLSLVADNQFGVNPADSRLSYSSNTNGFTVANGVVSVDSGVVAGSTATITITYTNPNTTTLTTTATVTATAAP